MNAASIGALAATMVEVERAAGYRFNVPARVLGQFAAHCDAAGVSSGPVVKDVVAAFLYGRGLRASTIRRNEIVIRDFAAFCREYGLSVWAPTALTPVRVDRQPPYVFTDDEIRRFFHAVDSRPISHFSNAHLVDPVLFRVLYGTGLRISEALKLTIDDVDPQQRTLQVRDSKNGKDRVVPVTGRLAATLADYILAAHIEPQPYDQLFYTRDVTRIIAQATIYTRFRAYLADADIPHYTGGPCVHTFRHGLAVTRLKRWAREGADLSAMLPYLSAYLGHVDLRGTQYYLRLTADMYPEIAALCQQRFGYLIPHPGQEQP